MDITDGHRNVITYFMFFTKDTKGGGGAKRGAARDKNDKNLLFWALQSSSCKPIHEKHSLTSVNTLKCTPVMYSDTSRAL